MDATTTTNTGSSLQGCDKRATSFRREAYGRSTDRSTVEDMADLVVHRVIGQAASCIERSLGMKFSMENLTIPQMDEDCLEKEDEDCSEGNNEDHTAADDDQSSGKKKSKRLKRSKVVQALELPNSSEFSRDQGPAIVDQIINSWNLNCALWERHLELVSEEKSPNYANYSYKVVFFPVSKATRYIQITASVDFNLIINHLDGKEPIKAEFRLEGQRYRHEPGQFRFREKWLLDIIEHKKKLIRQVSL